MTDRKSRTPAVGSPHVPDEEVAELAAAYWVYMRALATVPLAMWSDEMLPDRGAYDAVDNAIYHGPPRRALGLLIEVLRRGNEEDVPIVAHMLVDGFVKKQASVILEDFEREASRNARLCRCLGRLKVMVGELPPDIITRLVRASDGVMVVYPAGSWTYLCAAT